MHLAFYPLISYMKKKHIPQTNQATIHYRQGGFRYGTQQTESR
jgi:hypothetical protein